MYCFYKNIKLSMMSSICGNRHSNLPLQGANYCWRNNPGTLPRAKMNWAFSPQVFANENMRCISQFEQFQYMLIRGLEYTYSLIRYAPTGQLNLTRRHRLKNCKSRIKITPKVKLALINMLSPEHLLSIGTLAPKGQFNPYYRHRQGEAYFEAISAPKGQLNLTLRLRLGVINSEKTSALKVQLNSYQGQCAEDSSPMVTFITMKQLIRTQGQGSGNRVINNQRPERASECNTWPYFGHIIYKNE